MERENVMDAINIVLSDYKEQGVSRNSIWDGRGILKEKRRFNKSR